MLAIRILLGCIGLIFLNGSYGSCEMITEDSISNLVEFTSQPPFGQISTGREGMKEHLVAFGQKVGKTVVNLVISKLSKTCKKDASSSAVYHGGFIYPGTKWCGKGNMSIDYSDLGGSSKEDSCCREHDHCPKSMAPGTCERGICNKLGFTISHCDCDAKFKKCLQNVKSETADTIGAIFFNSVDVVCFREATHCSDNHGSDTNNNMKKNDDDGCPMWELVVSELYPASLPKIIKRSFSSCLHNGLKNLVNMIYPRS